MNNELPKFERSPVNPRNEEEDKEIWQPSWKCFCCHDTGRIYPTLVRLVITDYDYDKDKIPICQNCNAGSNWMHLQLMIDTRIDFKICRHLDKFERENWKRTTQQQFEIVKKQVGLVTNKIAQAHSLTSANRTQNDDCEVQQRKAEIEAITPEQWEGMNKSYLVGSNKDE
ncbi:hypothetical protein [Nostoc sp.]|uniref:hypothetical protein n=1 Tax=Nostoc sp. TaxID=1180 RepID=UPI002FFC8E69